MKLTTTSTKNGFISLLTVAAIVSSCSGFRPESIEDKMNRFKAQNNGDNIVPNSFVNNDLLIDAPTRGPASISSKNETKTSIPYNNKKLYFLTLLDQYKYMKTYSKSENTPELIICPKFHSLLVLHSENYPTNSYSNKAWTPEKYDKVKFTDDKYLASHPELSLPVSKGSIFPTVLDLIKKSNSQIEANKIVYTAFNLHLSKTYSELKELCEYGNSNNYYTFENLNTLVNRDVFKKNSKNLNILLRTTIFSNIALKATIEKYSAKTPSRGIASVDPDSSQLEDEIINRLGVEWSNDYFKAL
jgi:hypothetical protein